MRRQWARERDLRPRSRPLRAFAHHLASFVSRIKTNNNSKVMGLAMGSHTAGADWRKKARVRSLGSLIKSARRA